MVLGVKPPPKTKQKKTHFKPHGSARGKVRASAKS